MSTEDGVNLSVCLPQRQGKLRRNGIAHELAAVAHGKKVVVPFERKAISVPASVLAEFVGTVVGPAFGINITVAGDHLNRIDAQGTRQPKISLAAESEYSSFRPYRISN